MKYRYIALLFIVFLFLSGCGGQARRDAEKGIQEAFRARAEAVFLHKDKTGLNRYFSAGALEQSKKYLNWSPNGSWENIKDPAYRQNLLIDNLKVNGKRATADVFETAVVTWDFIDPELVRGQDFKKEAAWSNRLHKITLQLDPEGRWMVEEDIMQP